MPTSSTTLAKPDQVFYDGSCGLCHRTVKFALNHDPDGSRFRFSPLQGETVQSAIDPQRRLNLPDSIVVLTNKGQLLIRSDAALRIFSRLDGAWGTWARALTIVPRPLRDVVYSGVAAVRYRIFGRRKDLCPLMTQDQRKRFDP